MVVDFNAKSSKVISPTKLAHVVLRTNKFTQMVEYYRDLLGATVIHETSSLAFLSYDDEHHRIAIIGIPATQDKVKTSCGLEHTAFTFDSISDLLLAYRQRKDRGILYSWAINHGPTTSIYYTDPDGNHIETQVDNYEDPSEATKFMKSQEFGENPIGVDFDPEDYIRRLDAGEPEQLLKKRIEIGPRGLPEGF